jgi:hypothetical protein
VFPVARTVGVNPQQLVRRAVPEKTGDAEDGAEDDHDQAYFAGPVTEDVGSDENDRGKETDRAVSHAYVYFHCLIFLATVAAAVGIAVGAVGAESQDRVETAESYQAGD